MPSSCFSETIGSEISGDVTGCSMSAIMDTDASVVIDIDDSSATSGIGMVGSEMGSTISDDSFTSTAFGKHSGDSFSTAAGSSFGVGIGVTVSVVDDCTASEEIDSHFEVSSGTKTSGVGI